MAVAGGAQAAPLPHRLRLANEFVCNGSRISLTSHFPRIFYHSSEFTAASRRIEAEEDANGPPRLALGEPVAEMFSVLVGEEAPKRNPLHYEENVRTESSSADRCKRMIRKRNPYTPPEY